MMEASDALRPSYTSGFTGTPLAGELQLCAKLINAGLGTRVLTVRHGPYDSHTHQETMLAARMAELDEGIDRFFQTLSAEAADDVTLVCISEFGRRVAANGGFGTDHGAGNLMMAVGPRVVGGLHGALPSLTSLTRDGNLTHDIDYRSVFATILDDVLGVDHAGILGGHFDTVPFVHRAVPQPNPSLRDRRDRSTAVSTLDPRPRGRTTEPDVEWSRDAVEMSGTPSGRSQRSSSASRETADTSTPPSGATTTDGRVSLADIDVDAVVSSSTKIRGRFPISAIRR